MVEIEIHEESHYNCSRECIPKFLRSKIYEEYKDFTSRLRSNNWWLKANPKSLMSNGFNIRYTNQGKRWQWSLTNVHHKGNLNNQKSELNWMQLNSIEWPRCTYFIILDVKSYKTWNIHFQVCGKLSEFPHVNSRAHNKVNVLQSVRPLVRTIIGLFDATTQSLSTWNSYGNHCSCFSSWCGL